MFRDLTLLDKGEPKREDYDCDKYFYKACLNYEICKPLLDRKDVQPGDYECTLMINIHPAYASKGI